MGPGLPSSRPPPPTQHPAGSFEASQMQRRGVGEQDKLRDSKTTPAFTITSDDKESSDLLGVASVGEGRGPESVLGAAELGEWGEQWAPRGGCGQTVCSGQVS